MKNYDSILLAKIVNPKEMEMDDALIKSVQAQEFDPALLFNHGFNFFSSIDLIQGRFFREVVGRTIIYTMNLRKKQDGERVFFGATVILPPAGATKINEESVYEALSVGYEALWKIQPNEEVIAFLKKYVRVIRCLTLEAADLSELVALESSGRLVAIADGSKYRDSSVSMPEIVGLSSVRMAEDYWVPHVAGLCQRCVAAVRQTDSYAFVHVEETFSQNPELEAMLVAIEDCYPYLSRVLEDPNEYVNNNFQRWVSWALAGKTDDAIREIQTLKISESSRLHLMVQLMFRADLPEDALALIQKLRPYLEGFEKGHVLQIARIAFKCGDYVTAKQLQPRDPIGIYNETLLEEGLEIATQLEDNELIEVYDAHLAALFPNSKRLRENRDRRLMLNCREGMVCPEHIFTTAGFLEWHLEILGILTKQQPSYEDLIEKAKGWDRDWFELTIMCCAVHAQSVSNNLIAIDAGSRLTESPLYARQATQIILSATRSLMLEQEISKEDQEYYREPFIAAIRYLAQHPKDEDVRATFSRLLSVEACGELGLPLITVIMLDLIDIGVPLAENQSVREDDSVSGLELVDDDSVMSVLMRCMEWIALQGYVECGVTVVPRELVGDQADQVIRLISRMMLHAGSLDGQDADLDSMSRMVVVASAVRPYAITECDEDLRLLRLLAGHYALAGHFQKSRNLAEQILDIGKDSRRRRRLAWFAYGDVYLRCRNPIEAIIGLACAFATDAPVEKADLWQEVYAVIRICRELKMTELARKFLPALKKLIEELGFNPETDPRIVSTELGIRAVELSLLDAKDVSTLIDDIVKACHLSKNKSDAFPLAALLSQLVRVAEERSIPVQKEARSILNELQGQAGSREVKFMQIIASHVPTNHQVVSMFNSIERAMFGKDAATDLVIVGIAARRILSELGDPIDVAKSNTLAVEILADHTMTLFGSMHQLTEDWALQYALDLNKQGIDVAFMALNTSDELSVTVVSQGQAKVIAQPKFSQSFVQRMHAWLEKYPKAYGYIDAYDGNNEFLSTMDALGIDFPKSERLLIVAEPLLQQLTANLIVVHPKDDGYEYFYGSRVAVGFVPSLSWLSVTGSRGRKSKEVYRAWISADSGPDAAGTLDIALARLSGTFDEFGFIVDTARRLPRDMSDASIAVVTAHGGLTQEGRYLHSIRDEDALVESPSALATSLAGSEIVILFVCSGGRLDKHPWGNRTVGLPRQLLDQGVRAVIASPWPLDVKVTYTWLEPFMNAWNEGKSVLQATKVANELVAIRLGDNPQYSLAMCVYGDLLMTKCASVLV